MSEDLFVEDTSIYWTNFYFYYFDNIVVHPELLGYWSNCRDAYEFLFGKTKSKLWSYKDGGYTEDQWVKKSRDEWNSVVKICNEIDGSKVLKKNLIVKPKEKNYTTYSFLDFDDHKFTKQDYSYLRSYEDFKDDMSVRGMRGKDIELFIKSFYNSYDLGDSRDCNPLVDRLKMLLDCQFFIGSPCSWKRYADLLNKTCYLTVNANYTKNLVPVMKAYYLSKNY